MNGEKKDLMIWQYTVVVSVIILILCGLTLLLSSCTENIAGPLQSGKKITVNFLFNGVTENDEEVITRSDSGTNPETVIVPVGNDLCMVATLEVDRQIKTRAATTTTLPTGTRLRIVAYWEATSLYQTHADYEVDNGLLIAITPPLQVPAGNYKFVAYSYNSTTLPTHNNYTISNINTSTDLLWGDKTYSVTTSTHEEVPITMSHMLSRVKIEATTAAMGSNFITAITGVSISPGSEFHLTIADGTLSAGSIEVQNVISTWSGIGSPTIITDEPRLVYTNKAEAFQVKIGSLTLNGYPTPFTNLTATFGKKLEGGYSYTVKMFFRKSGDIIDDPTPGNLITYVGAFWKHNQTGERLIRIARPTIDATAADGAWTATVIVGNNWIVLDKEMTSDLNVGWRTDVTPVESSVHSYENSSFDAIHPVTGTSTSVNGILRTSGTGYQPGDEYIYFRIGLKGVHEGFPAVAARYGMVVLTYKNNTLVHRIWIRQGEGDDNIVTGSSTKWSPYNLADNRNPVIYPSQAGYFYQWINSAAFHPINPISVTPFGWVASGTTFNLGSVCPTNNTYFLPSGGNGGSSDLSALVALASTTATTPTWGYYADGWFDRRKIVGSAGMFGQANSTVSYNSANVADPINANVAYIGRLFYNPTTNASLFFPATGYRSPALMYAGNWSDYWSQSQYSTDEAWHLFMYGNMSYPMHGGASKTSARSVRCVRNN